MQRVDVDEDVQAHGGGVRLRGAEEEEGAGRPGPDLGVADLCCGMYEGGLRWGKGGGEERGGEASGEGGGGGRRTA